jgi:parvulin-like peptidyl-prolyl isomerase
MGSRTSRLLAAAVVVVLAAGCGSSAKVSAGQIAVVCGEPVQQAQFDSLMAEGRAAYTLQKQAFPAVGSSRYEQIKQNVVHLLVQHAEQREEGAKMGIDVTDAQVGKEIDTLIQAQAGGSQAKFRQALARQGLTLAEVRASARSNLLQKAIADMVTAKLTVSDAEIRAYYAQNRAQYRSPRARQVREVVVKTKAEALKVIAQADAGADVAALARKLSLDPNAKRTGGRQLLQDGTLSLDDAAAVFALPVGQVSKPVRVGRSWAVVKAVGPVQPSRQVPLARVRLPIVQYILGQKRQAALRAWQSEVDKRCGSKASYADGYGPASG